MNRLTLCVMCGLSFFVTSIASAVVIIGGSANNGNLDLTYAEVIVENAPPGPGAEDFFLPKPQVWQNEGSRTVTGPYEDEMESVYWGGREPTPLTTDGNSNPPYPRRLRGSRLRRDF